MLSFTIPFPFVNVRLNICIWSKGAKREAVLWKRCAQMHELTSLSALSKELKRRSTTITILRKKMLHANRWAQCMQVCWQMFKGSEGCGSCVTVTARVGVYYAILAKNVNKLIYIKPDGQQLEMEGMMKTKTKKKEQEWLSKSFRLERKVKGLASYLLSTGRSQGNRLSSSLSVSKPYSFSFSRSKGD